jgi:hypothetical protein
MSDVDCTKNEDNREFVERRTSGSDRRLDEGAQSLDRRRGPGRRLSDFVRLAEEGEMSREQIMFLHAIDAFKQANHVSFPSWTDVLEVVRRLGYRKTMASELNLGARCEDWVEAADAPNCVDHNHVESSMRYRKAG